MSAIDIHTEELEVFEVEDSSRKRGILSITETTYKGATERTWTWQHGPVGHDNGDFEWRQQFLILNSFISDPKTEVWAVVNRSWKPGSIVPKPKPWFSETDKVIVTDETRPPYPRFQARPRR